MEFTAESDRFFRIACKICRKTIGEATLGTSGKVRLYCRRCKELRTISLQVILKETTISQAAPMKAAA